MKFTHFDEKGNARMVDVTHKERTERIAVASGKIKVSGEVFEAVRGKGRCAYGSNDSRNCRGQENMGAHTHVPYSAFNRMRRKVGTGRG